MTVDVCGGCRGLGSHRRLCPRNPDYHPWKRLAQMANDIGDSIGSNDPGLANRAYQLGALITAGMADHPYRPVRLREGTPQDRRAISQDGPA